MGAASPLAAAMASATVTTPKAGARERGAFSIQTSPPARQAARAHAPASVMALTTTGGIHSSTPPGSVTKSAAQRKSHRARSPA